jgi:AbrB family looped-hinge helix DNA binding protein
MTQTVEVTLDESGRITIPATLKERLGLAPGMTLLVEEGDEQRLCLRIQPEPEAELVDKGGVLVVRGKPLEDLTDITKREREQRVVELARQAAG